MTAPPLRHRLAQVYIAFVFALSGGLAGAAIALRWASNGFERAAGVQ